MWGTVSLGSCSDTFLASPLLKNFKCGGGLFSFLFKKIHIVDKMKDGLEVVPLEIKDCKSSNEEQ